jgi:predicted acylesterase/phospholipase RssA
MPNTRRGRIPRRKTDRVQEALLILHRQKPALPGAMLELARELKAEMHMNYARRLLLRASHHDSLTQDEGLRRKIFQQLALCSYKDQDLLPDDRFQRALDALSAIDDFTTTKDQETLGLLGAIYKRKWEIDNQRQNLERAFRYYLRGYEQGPANDQGYTGINAAFVLDQLADILEKEAKAIGGSSNLAATHRSQAQDIRRNILNQVEPLIRDPGHKWVSDKWWYYSTIGEAHFGLGQYDQAVHWLTEGQKAAVELYEWELESCARQLAALARFQDATNAGAFNTLQKAFGESAVARTAFTGKIGLALSGGGFRASLFHLGVLARLAELDLLRPVEVISCVSGGSIVGAYYYLMVRRLLETRADKDITRDDYIRIVKEMIVQFTAGVQQNIRTRVIVNPLKNLRMLLWEGYSRTNRAGELYEKHLYARIKDGGENAERWLNDLTIAPWTMQGEGKAEKDTNFSPKYQNWRRDAKVPILVLNAATLNTGHTWQFTASWMGESPEGIDTEIDGNDRLRRMYYADAPERYRRIRLGDAVGASAGVPAIFEPMTLDNLYPDRIIRLVDGGVCDNQGLGSLFEQDCRVMLVSDASGQMESQPASSRGILGVLLRSNAIFQARIRQAEYHDLKGRKRSGLLRGLMFVHLKADLDVDPIDWNACPDPYDNSDDPRRPGFDPRLTRYGIPRELQELLSGIRTDLDSFSEAEAYALMLSGYRITEDQLKDGKCVEGLPPAPPSEFWEFFQIEPLVQGKGKGYAYLKKLLKAGGGSVFKVWQIDAWLKYALRAGVIVAAISIAAFFWQSWTEPLPGLSRIAAWLNGLTFGKAVVTGATLLSTYIATRIVASAVGDAMTNHAVAIVRIQDTLRRAVRVTLLSTVGFAIAAIHLYIFDRRFLQLGRIATLKKK